MKKWESFLPHLSFCMLLCLLVFMILDGYNPFMYWLTSTASKIYIALCCGVGMLTAALQIVRQYRGKR